MALRNAGEKDISINLGVMLGNGNVQNPDRIGFLLTDAGGRRYQLKFEAVMVVSGRMDDYIVPLRAGSVYMLKLSSEHFYAADPQLAVSKLSGGRYTIAAVFEGGGAVHSRGLNLLGFWSGKVASNALIIE